MSIFTKNKEAIIKRGLKLEALLEGNKEEESIFQIITEQSMDKDTYMIIKKDESTYRMNSLYSPGKEAEYWVKQFDFNKDGIVASLYGLGNGCFARAIKMSMREDGILFIVEPSPQLFLKIIQEYDISDLISSHNVVITVLGINDDLWSDSLEYVVRWHNINDQIYCEHPIYTKVFPDEIKTFENILIKNNERVSIGRNTEAYFGKKYVYNMIDSLHCLPKMNSLVDCKEMMSGDVTAFIVAAGPSLDINVNDLKLAKNKSIIFATDRALPTLFKNNVIPDIIVTVDPDKADICFENPLSRKLPLICPVHAKREALERQEGRLFLVACYEYMINLYKKMGSDIPVLDTGASVATATFAICQFLGIKRIVLVGQDLAYKGSVTHTGGDEEKVCINEVIYTEGIYGEPVRTRYDWEEFRLWFERKIKDFNDKMEVIDATEGGALIHGTEVMSLKDTILKYCIKDFNAEEKITNIPLFWSKDKKLVLLEYIRQGIYECKELIERVEGILQICSTSLEDIERDIINAHEFNENHKKIIETNDLLEELSIYKLVDLAIFKVAVNKHKEVDMRIEEEGESYRQLFSVYQDVYREMLDMVKEMKVRFEEQLELIQEV